MNHKLAGSKQHLGQLPVRCRPLPAARQMLAAVGLLLAGCQLLSPSNYFPLGFGFNWSYLQTKTDSTIWSPRVIWPPDSIETQVLGVVDRWETGGWKVETRSPQTGSRLTYYVQESDRILAYDSLAESAPKTVLRLPLAEGLTWVSDSTAKAGRITLTVQGRDNMVILGDTTRDIWRIRETWQTDTGVVSTHWYANGIGEVKESTFVIRPLHSDSDTFREYTVRRLTAYTTQ